MSHPAQGLKETISSATSDEFDDEGHVASGFCANGVQPCKHFTEITPFRVEFLAVELVVADQQSHRGTDAGAHRLPILVQRGRVRVRCDEFDDEGQIVSSGPLRWSRMVGRRSRAHDLCPYALHSRQPRTAAGFAFDDRRVIFRAHARDDQDRPIDAETQPSRTSVEPKSFCMPTPR